MNSLCRTCCFNVHSKSEEHASRVQAPGLLVPSENKRKSPNEDLFTRSVTQNFWGKPLSQNNIILLAWGRKYAFSLDSFYPTPIIQSNNAKMDSLNLPVRAWTQICFGQPNQQGGRKAPSEIHQTVCSAQNLAQIGILWRPKNMLGLRGAFCLQAKMDVARSTAYLWF